jgi:hypothetical protein
MITFSKLVNEAINIIISCIMSTNVASYKDQFLVSEFLMFSLSAGLLTRNSLYPIYAPLTNENEKGNLRKDLKNFLRAYSNEFNSLTETDHYNKVELMSTMITEKHHDVLDGGKFRIGISQKIINLFLKYMWTIERIKMPFHCPFDNIIKTRLLAGTHGIYLQDWTEFDSIEEYRKFVNLAQIKATEMNLSIAEWELLMWNRR